MIGACSEMRYTTGVPENVKPIHLDMGQNQALYNILLWTSHLWVQSLCPNCDQYGYGW
jgi:hypothetical protein